MSDDQSMLSQDEIDALLQGDFGLDDLEEEEEQESVTGIFSAEQMRLLLEISDAILVREVSVLNDFINREVVLAGSKQPELLSGNDLKEDLLSTEHVLVTTNFDAGKSGIVITGLSGAIFTSLMTDGEWNGDPDFEFDEFKLSALQDCFTGLMGKVVPALKTVISKDYVSSPPQAIVLSGKEFPPEASLLREPNLVQVTYDLSIGDEPPSQFRYLISEELAKAYILAKDPSSSFGDTATVDEPASQDLAPAPVPASEPAPAMEPDPTAMGGMDPQAMMHQQMAQQQQMTEQQMQQQMQQQMAQPQMMAPGQVQPMQAGGVPGAIPGMMQPGMAMQPQGQQMGFSSWQFPPIAPGSVGAASGNMDLLKDVSLQITVELGRATMPIGQVLELLNGSIVELNKQAGEAVELYVQGKLIARGEVVIIDENFGVRITSIISQQERMESVGK
jgi:flagellar motor switch protein FliN